MNLHVDQTWSCVRACRACEEDRLTCSQPSALSSAVLLHSADKGEHLYRGAVPQLQATGLQRDTMPFKSKRCSHKTILQRMDWAHRLEVEFSRQHGATCKLWVSTFTWISKPNVSLSCFSSSIVILCQREMGKRVFRTVVCLFSCTSIHYAPIQSKCVKKNAKNSILHVIIAQMKL